MATRKLKGFTIIEFLLYIGIAGIFIAIILPIITRTIKSVSYYQAKVNVRNEFSKISQKIMQESQNADSLNILPNWGIIFWKGNEYLELRVTKPNLISGTKLTGYAWSYQVGGIALNGTTTEQSPETFQVERTANSGCQITIDTPVESSFLYDGYAWSPNIGWIDFRDMSGQSEYGVCEQPNGDLRGYAWNDVIGWISFNCIDSNVCATANYKVSQSNGRLIGNAYNDVIGWFKFDGDEEKIYLWDGGNEELFTNEFVKVKNLNFENIGKTTRFNLSISNIDETKTFTGTSTLTRFSK